MKSKMFDGSPEPEEEEPQDQVATKSIVLKILSYTLLFPLLIWLFFELVDARYSVSYAWVACVFSILAGFGYGMIIRGKRRISLKTMDRGFLLLAVWFGILPAQLLAYVLVVAAFFENIMDRSISGRLIGNEEGMAMFFFVPFSVGIAICAIIIYTIVRFAITAIRKT